MTVVIRPRSRKRAIFWAATRSAGALTSLATIRTRGAAFATAIATAPLPVPRSMIRRAAGCVRNQSIASSTSNSLSGRGIRTAGVTVNMWP